MDLPIITSTIENLVQISDNLTNAEQLKTRLSTINDLAKKVYDKYQTIPTEQVQGKSALEIIQALMKQISEQMKSDTEVDPEKMHEQMKELLELMEEKLTGTKKSTFSDMFNYTFGIKKPSEETKKTQQEVEEDNKLLVRGNPAKLAILKQQYSVGINNNMLETIVAFAISNIQLFILELLHIDTFYQQNSSLFMNRNQNLMRPMHLPNTNFYKQDLRALSQYIYTLISNIKDKFDVLHVKEIVNSLLDQRFGPTTTSKTRFNIVYATENDQTIQNTMYYLLNIEQYTRLIDQFYLLFKNQQENVFKGDLLKPSKYSQLIRLIKLYQPAVLSTDKDKPIDFLITKARPKDKDLSLFLLFNTLKKNSTSMNLNSSTIKEYMLHKTSKYNYLLNQLTPYDKNIDITSLLVDSTGLFSLDIFNNIHHKLDELYYKTFDKQNKICIVNRKIIYYYFDIIYKLIQFKQYYNTGSISPIYIDTHKLLTSPDAMGTNIKSIYDRFFKKINIFKYIYKKLLLDNQYEKIRYIKILYLFHEFNKIYNDKDHIQYARLNLALVGGGFNYVATKNNINVAITDMYNPLNLIRPDNTVIANKNDIIQRLYDILGDYILICREYINIDINISYNINDVQVDNVNAPALERYLNVKYTESNDKRQLNLNGALNNANILRINQTSGDLPNNQNRMHPDVLNNGAVVDPRLLFPTTKNIVEMVKQMNEYITLINTTIGSIQKDITDQISVKKGLMNTENTRLDRDLKASIAQHSVNETARNTNIDTHLAAGPDVEAYKVELKKVDDACIDIMFHVYNINEKCKEIAFRSAEIAIEYAQKYSAANRGILDVPILAANNALNTFRVIVNPVPVDFNVYNRMGGALPALKGAYINETVPDYDAAVRLDPVATPSKNDYIMFFGFIDYAIYLIEFSSNDYYDIIHNADLPVATANIDRFKNDIIRPVNGISDNMDIVVKSAIIQSAHDLRHDISDIRRGFKFIKDEVNKIISGADFQALDNAALNTLTVAKRGNHILYEDNSRLVSRLSGVTAKINQQKLDNFKVYLNAYDPITQINMSIQQLKPFDAVDSTNALITYYKAFNLYTTYDKNKKIDDIKDAIIGIHALNQDIDIPTIVDRGKLNISVLLLNPAGVRDPAHPNIDNYYIEIKLYELHMAQLLLSMVCMLPCIVYEYIFTTISDVDSKQYHKEIDEYIMFLLRKMTLITNPPYDLIYYNEESKDEEQMREVIDKENHKIINKLTPGILDDIKSNVLDEMIVEEQLLLDQYEKPIVMTKQDMQYLYDYPVDEPKYTDALNTIPNPDSILNKHDPKSMLYQLIYYKFRDDNQYNFQIPDTQGMNDMDKKIAMIAKYKLHYIEKYEMYLSQEYIQYNLLDKLMIEHREEKNYSMLSRFLLSS